MKLTTSTGIALDDDLLWVQELNNYIKHKGLTGLHVFVATFTDNTQTYLLVDGQEPIGETSCFEAMVTKLDIIKLTRQNEP